MPATKCLCSATNTTSTAAVQTTVAAMSWFQKISPSLRNVVSASCTVVCASSDPVDPSGQEGSAPVLNYPVELTLSEVGASETLDPSFLITLTLD